MKPPGLIDFETLLLPKLGIWIDWLEREYAPAYFPFTTHARHSRIARGQGESKRIMHDFSLVSLGVQVNVYIAGTLTAIGRCEKLDQGTN